VTNGGTAPKFVWKKNGETLSATGSTFSSKTLNDKDEITCELTSNADCVTSAVVLSPKVVAKVLALPAKPVVTLSDDVLSSSYATGSHQWYSGETPIDGATSRTYKVTASGVYKVKYTDQCTSMSLPFTVVITNAKAELNEDVVFPNPCTDRIHFRFSCKDNRVIRITSTTGKTVFNEPHSGDELTVDMSSSATGIYIVSIQEANGIFFRKVAKH
jgi:hypothetical protein